MNSEFPIYNIVLDEDSLGLTAISLVDYPAIEENFLAFRKAEGENMIWMSSNEKREVVSPALIPNQLILRQTDDGMYYYIRWTEKTIMEAAERYLANMWFNNFTVMHPTFYDKDMKYEDALEKDIYMLRMWIIEDENTDDANTKYNFSLPKGTLMVHFKVMNRKIWKRIKSGELRGVSIEAFTGLERADGKINIKDNTMMAKFDINNKQMSLFRRFVMFLNEVTDEAEAIADVVRDDNAEAGEVTVKYWVDNDHYMQVDSEGFVRDEESNLVAEGKYMLQDGSYIVVDKDNKFVETLEGTDENIDEDEKPEEAPIAEEKVKKDEENEENNEEDEPVVDEPQGEDGGEPAEGSDEPLPVDPEAADEVPEAEPATTLVPFEIDGEEFLLPQPVVDYINGIVGENKEKMAEVQMLRSRIPSAEPIPTVQKGEKEDYQGLSGIIRLMNHRK